MKHRSRSRPRHRLERVDTLVQQILADALATRVKDPRVGFVTVTHVSVTADLAHAVIHVSVLGDEDAKAAAMAGLDSAKGFLRSQVARAATLRITPELRFELDRSLEHAARIDELLAQTKRNGEDH